MSLAVTSSKMKLAYGKAMLFFPRRFSCTMGVYFRAGISNFGQAVACANAHTACRKCLSITELHANCTKGLFYDRSRSQWNPHYSIFSNSGCKSPGSHADVAFRICSILRMYAMFPWSWHPPSMTQPQSPSW